LKDVVIDQKQLYLIYMLGSGVRTIGSWLEASVKEIVFWCVEYELITS
jgi:hypothetical protein